MKKFLMILAICLSLGFAGNRIHDFYQERFPVAEPGQCVAISADTAEGQIKATVLVLQNDAENKQTIVLSLTNWRVVRIPYAEMRQLSPKVVECP